MNECSACVGPDVHQVTVAVTVAMPGREESVSLGRFPTSITAPDQFALAPPPVRSLTRCSPSLIGPSGDESVRGVRATRSEPASIVAAPQRSRHNGPMIRSELMHRIAQKQFQRAERDVELAVTMMLEHTSECLACGGCIEIRGFGSFTLRCCPARVGRNPKSVSVSPGPSRCGTVLSDPPRVL